MTPLCKNLDLSYAAVSDTGRVREENQDRWLAVPELGLFAIADGMGGHVAGSLAAQLTVDLLPRLVEALVHEKLSPSQRASRLCESVGRLSALVREETEGQPGISGLGSTLAVVLVGDVETIVVHAGDSRVYYLHKGVLTRLTKDHTAAEFLLERGESTELNARARAARHQLTRFVGMPGQLRPEWTSVPFRPQERMLLCSDGLYNAIGDALLTEIVSSAGDLEALGGQLVDAANAAGGRDNITGVLVQRRERRGGGISEC